MSNKKLKLQEVKEHIENLSLKEEEKSNSFKRIEDWYAQDKAIEELYLDLSNISEVIKEYFAELGLV
jgi:hypothetical protein